jgi:hypothetical protein
MKTSFPPLALFIAVLIGIGVACNTTQQRITANTLGAAEATATAAVDNYYKATIMGLARTNGIPAVSRTFNIFQGTMVLAVDLAQNNTNSLAPASINQELSDLLKVIGSFYYTNQNMGTTTPYYAPTK